MVDFYPHQLAADIIEESDIETEEVYNDRDGVTRAQLTALSSASSVLGVVVNTDGTKTTLKDNVYSTIHKLNASANKKKIDFAANIKNTIYNTVQFEVMNKLESQTTTKQRKDIMIVWLASRADEQDPFHSLNYGHTMSMQDALDKGLGVRYGCQCGMGILDDNNDIEEIVRKNTNSEDEAI